MKKLKLSTLVDASFIFFSLFLVFYALLKVVFKKIILTTFIAILISFIITFLFILYANYKDVKKNQIKESEEELLAFKNYLILKPNYEILNLIFYYYKSEYTKVEIVNNSVFIKDINTIIYFDFLSKSKGLKDILLVYKNLKSKENLIYLALAFDSEVLSFIKDNNLKITTVEINEFFSLLKNKNLLPSLEIKKTNKTPLKTLFLNIIKKENSKKFLKWGAIILLLSTFAYYKALYIIVGTLFVLLSLYLRFFIKESKKG